MNYSIITFGCRVNQADSLQLEEDLRARGGVEAASSRADLVIVNTCSVTATADQGARQTIRRIARENPRRDRRDRLLRDAPAGRCRGASRRRPGGAATTTSSTMVDAARGCRRADDRATFRRRRRPVRRADRARRRRAARPSRCASRPAARSAAATASFRRRAARAAACRLPTCVAKSSGRSSRVQGDRADRRPSRVVRPRPAAARSLLELLRALDATSSRRDVPHQLARADGLHAGDRRLWWPRAAAGSRRISTSRCSTPATGCSR